MWVAIRYKLNYIIGVLNKQEMKMTKMISKTQAKSLAISYNAFCEAMDDDDILGQRVWGSDLLDVQNETGITLVKTITLKKCLNIAKRKVA